MLLGREQKVGRLRETVAIPAAGSKLPANLKAPPCLFSQPATLRNTQFKATVRFRGMQASKRQRRCGQRGHWGLCQNCCGAAFFFMAFLPILCPRGFICRGLKKLGRQPGGLSYVCWCIYLSVPYSYQPYSENNIIGAREIAQ